MNKKLLGLFVAGIMTAGIGAAADIRVDIGPPRPLVERRGPPPGAGYVWVPGYQRWDGHAYVWTRGEWQRPPHPHAKWHAHRWVKRHGHWDFVEGGWR